MRVRRVAGPLVAVAVLLGVAVPSASAVTVSLGAFDLPCTTSPGSPPDAPPTGTTPTCAALFAAEGWTVTFDPNTGGTGTADITGMHTGEYVSMKSNNAGDPQVNYLPKAGSFVPGPIPPCIDPVCFSAGFARLVPEPITETAGLDPVDTELRISRMFTTVAAGDKVTGYAAFDNKECSPVDDVVCFNDRAMVRILDAANSVVAIPYYADSASTPVTGALLAGGASSFYCTEDFNGEAGCSDGPWTYFEWIAPDAGMFTIEFSVVNSLGVRETSHDSYGLLDQVQLITALVALVPGPSPLVLIGIGVGLGLVGRRKKK